jgi:hypothetical protein
VLGQVRRLDEEHTRRAALWTWREVLKVQSRSRDIRRRYARAVARRVLGVWAEHIEGEKKTRWGGGVPGGLRWLWC